MGRWIVVGVIVLWIVCMWYVLVYALMRGWGPYIRSKRQKKTRVRAVVKDKLGSQEMDPFEMRMAWARKVLLFECEDGVERDYEVHDDVWDWVEIGDAGELVYQGDLFVAFDAYRPRHDPDKLMKRLTRG